MVSSSPTFEIINVPVRNPNFVWIPVSTAVVVNPNGIKTLLANGLITFSIKGEPVFSNGPRSLPRSPLDCTVLDS